MTNYPRGSEWRRWDIHIHTPGTALGDRYGSWDAFIEKLSTHKGVSVVGVTDYLGIEHYSKLKQLKSAGQFGNIELLLPNVEFRVLPATEKHPGANLHLLIDPTEADHELKIAQALSRYIFKLHGQPYGCTPDQLKTLGRAVGGAMGDGPAYRKGVEQFRPDVQTFLDWFNNETWLRANSLICVVAGGDGLSGWPAEGALQATRDNLAKAAQAIFSGRDGEIEFWHLRKSKAHVVEHAKSLGAPKPCLHGSDAHSLDDLFNPAMGRQCWIKSDPTFAGLRQVVYEPELRVSIGPQPPSPANRAHVIESIEIQHGQGWFDTTKVLLNDGLVAVIGQKGSGKSALAELCALGCGAWTSDGRAFLDRAAGELNGLKVIVQWLDGSQTNAVVGGESPEFPLAKYLSQSFVETLCAGDDSSSAALVKEIEEVVFWNLDEADRLGYGSFGELRSAVVTPARTARDQSERFLAQLIAEETALRFRKAQAPEKQRKLDALKSELEGLLKQLPSKVDDRETALLAAVQKSQSELSALQAAEAKDKQALNAIASIRGRTAAFQREMHSFYADLVAQLRAISLPEPALPQYEPIFRGDIESPLRRRESELNATIRSRRVPVVAGQAAPFDAVTKSLEDSQKLLATDKVRRDQLVRQSNRVAELRRDLATLAEEVAHIGGAQRLRLEALRAERSKIYQETWHAIGVEKSALEKLYDPVRGELGTDLRVAVEVSVDIESWIERGGNLFDQRRVLPFGSIDALRRRALADWKFHWLSADPLRAQIVVDALLTELNSRPEILQSLRSAFTIKDVLEWVFSTDHISLKYTLTHHEIELRKLSPGQKGIVLLMVYLGLDRSDTSPLIIDQPEENLDNESIYDDLVSFFRSAKLRRQVILVTHNPNLVVNSDADQVIVTKNERQDSGLPKISYFSGSLEHSEPPNLGVREHVCRILEGGEIAFQKRERRYFART